MGTRIRSIAFQPEVVEPLDHLNMRQCRLCLASFDSMIELFSEEAIQMKINDKLHQFCHLEIREDDNAPKLICFTCLNEVNRFCDFYRRVQDNQKLLALPNKIYHIDNVLNPEGDIVDAEVDSDGNIIIAIAEEDIKNANGIECNEDDEKIEIFIADNLEEDDNNEEICEEVSHEEIYPTSNSRTVTPEQDDADLGSECDADNPPEAQFEEEISEQSTNNIIKPCLAIEPLGAKENNVSKSISLIESEPTSKRRTRHPIALDRPIREFFRLHCEKCEMSFQTFQSIKNHMACIHNEQFHFICCNRKLSRRDVIIEHIDSHLNPKKFTCEVCNQVCKSKITLKMHLKQHIPKDQQPFACDKCGFRFALKSQLKSHMNTHLTNEEKKFVCDQCGKAFAFKFVLDKHKKRMHIRQKNYMCEICARSFVDKVNLTAHKRIHDTSLPRLECHKCNALLKTKKTLKIHMRVHDPSQFPCEMCSKVFPTKNGLLNHTRYYHTDRKYPCTTCGRVFKKALNLKEHMATHTGEVLYNCEYCDKTFNAKANRYAHIKKVHPVEWANKQKLRWRIKNDKDSE